MVPGGLPSLQNGSLAPGALLALLEPSWAALGALLTAPKSCFAEKPKILDSTAYFYGFCDLQGQGAFWGPLATPGACEVVFGGSWVASTGDVVRSGDGTQRNSAEISANQPQRNAAQRSKAIVTGTVSCRSAYHYHYHYHY